MPDEPRELMPPTDNRCEQHDEAIKVVRERTHALSNELMLVKGDMKASLQHLETLIPERLGEQMVGLSIKLDNAIRDIAELKGIVRADFISRHEFDPIKKIVYGMVSLILTAVVVALIALVVRKP